MFTEEVVHFNGATWLIHKYPGERYIVIGVQPGVIQNATWSGPGIWRAIKPWRRIPCSASSAG